MVIDFSRNNIVLIVSEWLSCLHEVSFEVGENHSIRADQVNNNMITTKKECVIFIILWLFVVLVSVCIFSSAESH